jgi:hypothetical protein
VKGCEREELVRIAYDGVFSAASTFHFYSSSSQLAFCGKARDAGKSRHAGVFHQNAAFLNPLF